VSSCRRVAFAGRSARPVAPRVRHRPPVFDGASEKATAGQLALAAYRAHLPVRIYRKLHVQSREELLVRVFAEFDPSQNARTNSETLVLSPERVTRSGGLGRCVWWGYDWPSLHAETASVSRFTRRPERAPEGSYAKRATA